MPAPLPSLNGRRFSCTRCGACCREPGFVFVSEKELAAIATHLGETIDGMHQRMKIDRANDRFSIDATDGTGCPLLSKDGACTVQPVKPQQCASFPFWPELVDDADAWAEAKRFCPGMDDPQGKIYSRGEILGIRAGWMGT